MPRRLNLPDSASLANAEGDGRMYAPSAARNADVIGELVALHAPATGRVLEIASGTGEHSVHIARHLSGLVWQPSDIDAARRVSIDAHGAVAGLDNLRPAIDLDATTAGWAAAHGGQDVILVVNLLHLVSWNEAQILIKEAAAALAPGGVLILYGPFMRAGELTSAGDETFHQSLQAQDAELGYKDDFDVIDALQGAWLDLVEVNEMPANNLSFVARRGA